MDSLATSVVNLIGNQEIVGLGEGTHGTAEFNQIRAAITRKLIAQKGFRYICFEHNFGETALFAKDLLSTSATDHLEMMGLLKKHFIGIYQNKEILEFFSWLHAYNKETKDPISLIGIDYAEALGSILTLESSMKNVDECKPILNRLKSNATYLDSCWNSQSIPQDAQMWLEKGVESVDLIDNVEKIAMLKKKRELPFKMSLLNIKLVYETFNRYRLKATEVSRDSLLFQMVKQVQDVDKHAKMIIWAHDGHVAKGEVFENEKPLGNILKDYYPGNYFSVGTITSGGKYLVTKDRFPTRYNTFFPTSLQKPINGSVEQYLDGLGQRQCLFYPGSLFDHAALKHSTYMRFAGYNFTKKNTFQEVNLWSCFDVLVYFRKTNPSRLFR
ncbi:hypothetical protein GCM10023231_16860 [Olivibacter ginsenosidimutans]|uniref:Erythromycin esterase family protein n=2 Tax=Olivibacter ginsenosidimutans TaxID=1176537 RepID=A0ABP9B4J4_9SPHI